MLATCMAPDLSSFPCYAPWSVTASAGQAHAHHGGGDGVVTMLLVRGASTLGATLYGYCFGPAATAEAMALQTFHVSLPMKPLCALGPSSPSAQHTQPTQTLDSCISCMHICGHCTQHYWQAWLEHSSQQPSHLVPLAESHCMSCHCQILHRERGHQLAQLLQPEAWAQPVVRCTGMLGLVRMQSAACREARLAWPGDLPSLTPLKPPLPSARCHQQCVPADTDSADRRSRLHACKVPQQCRYRPGASDALYFADRVHLHASWQAGRLPVKALKRCCICSRMGAICASLQAGRLPVKAPSAAAQ